MLKALALTNYRGFSEHTLSLRPFTIAVGENNAGKSTVVEALRLIAMVTERYRHLQYRPPPPWADLPRRDYGVSPSLRGTELQFATLYHRYGVPPATIEATFDSNASISIRLGGNGAIHAVIRSPEGEPIRSKTQAAQIDIPRASAMPQLSPVEMEEPVLTEDYVRSALSSPLASRHFRNQLFVLRQLFTDFQEIAEENWRQLQIQTLEIAGRGPDARLSLQVRNQDFVGELGLMGHGLQMWLQVIWFVTRSRESSIIILHEPDVYMHPDLQRKLVRYLRSRFQQIVITTHSVEIMSEVDPDQILIIDRRRRASTFASDVEAVQRVLTGLGSAQNIHLTRLWATRRLLLVEGKDAQMLVRVHALLFPDSDSLALIPNMEIGGWSGWHYAVGSSMTFRNAMGQNVTCYCLLDPDYHTPEELTNRLEDARRRHVELHIWSRKEIENFLIVPSVISRIINDRLRHGEAPTEEEILAKANELAFARRDETVDGFANEYLNSARAAGIQAANRKARQYVGERQKQDNCLLGLTSGKALFSDLSRWATVEFGVSFGPSSVLSELRRDEIPEELRLVVTTIDRSGTF